MIGRSHSLGAPWLVAAGILSAVAAVLHVAIIFGGPNWYRFFGAGEGMARMAERGSPTPVIITLGIAAILSIWAAYAFSGAGVAPRLPWLRTGLIVITVIYLLRGLVLAPALLIKRTLVTPFVVWSSLIVLGYGAVYAVGVWRAWPSLAPQGSGASPM